MAEFINTADVIGEDEMCDQIIMRTVTEYKENRITTVGRYAFDSCTQLALVDLPNAEELGERSFYGCTALKEIKIPLVTEAGANAFNRCASLTTIIAPKLSRLNTTTFYGCSALTEVDFPQLSSIAYNTFEDCKSLTKIDFPLLTSVSSVAFSGCTNLKTAIFAKATNIGNTVFKNTALTALVLRSLTLCTLGGTTTFTGTPIESGTGYIYVPRALLSDTDATKDYRRATNWSTHAAQFRALEDYTVDGTVTGELDETKI